MSVDLEELIEELIEERDLNCTPAYFRARTAIRKLAHLYEDTEYGDLWLAILGMAIVDVAEYGEGEMNSFFAVDAHEYLSRDEIPACEVAGLDSDYVKRIVSNTLQIELG